MSMVKLGNGYALDPELMINSLFESSGGGSYDLVIPGDIISYDYNEAYIILLRKSRESTYENDPVYYKRWSRFKGDKYQFWIVNKTAEELLGPMNLEGYLVKREELNLSEKLKLDI